MRRSYKFIKVAAFGLGMMEIATVSEPYKEDLVYTQHFSHRRDVKLETNTIVRANTGHGKRA